MYTYLTHPFPTRRSSDRSATSWRIERRPARVARAAPLPQRAPQPRAREPSTDIVAAAQDEIIVTASKTDLPHSHFAGVVTQLDGGDLAFGGERGMDSILSRTASVSSTHLGPGRNKLFIRGIADSSFTGPPQSTVGQYFGDIRLRDRKSTRLNSSHYCASRMPPSA